MTGPGGGGVEAAGLGRVCHWWRRGSVWGTGGRGGPVGTMRQYVHLSERAGAGWARGGLEFGQVASVPQYRSVCVSLWGGAESAGG